MTVSDIETNMSHKELVEWQAYNKYIEPVGGEFLDNQFASLRIQNYGGDEKLTLNDFKMYNYCLKTLEEKEQESLELARQKAIISKEALREFLKGKVSKTD